MAQRQSFWPVWVTVAALLLAASPALEAAPRHAPAASKAQPKAHSNKAAKPKAKRRAKSTAKSHATVVGTLRIGTTGDYPPFSWRDPVSGQYQGSDIDQAAALAKSLGKHPQFVPTTWATLQADQAAGRFDIAMGGISVTPERSKRGLFSNAYLQDGKTPVVRCAEIDRYQTVEQINQPSVRVVVNPGGTNEQFARSMLWRSTLSVFSDNTAIFDELVEQRADVMVTDAIEGRLQQRLRPGLCVAHPDRPFTHSAKAYWMGKNATLRKQVNAWLAKSLATGTAHRTLERWLDHPWTAGQSADAVAVRRIATLIDERLALMPDVARYKWNTGGAIEDPVREQQLLESVRQQAVEQGLPPARVTAFFAAQIEAAKVVQRELFEQWHKSGQGKFEAVVDLSTQIRPRLDALNPQFLEALAAVPAAVTRDHVPALSFTAISPAAVAAAMAPLLERGAGESLR
jgi:chorismate mutase-like protein